MRVYVVVLCGVVMAILFGLVFFVICAAKTIKRSTRVKSQRVNVWVNDHASHIDDFVTYRLVSLYLFFLLFLLLFLLLFWAHFGHILAIFWPYFLIQRWVRSYIYCWPFV